MLQKYVFFYFVCASELKLVFLSLSPPSFTLFFLPLVFFPLSPSPFFSCSLSLPSLQKRSRIAYSDEVRNELLGDDGGSSESQVGS